MFEDARSDITGLTAAASLRTEQELSIAPSGNLSTDLAATEGLTAQPPHMAGVETLSTTAGPGMEASTRDAPASEAEAVPLAGGDAVPMTPRTRARMDPMGDIVRMIETGSARKGARPPNLPPGAPPAAATAGSAAAATGTNLGAAFDMEAVPVLSTTEQRPQATSAQEDPLEAITEPAGAEFLPPAAVGAAKDITEPVPGDAAQPEAAATEHHADEQQPLNSVQAAAVEAITEPAGAEFLPPSAVTDLSADVTEPLRGSAQPAEPAGPERTEAIMAHEPAEAVGAVMEPVDAEAAISEDAAAQPDVADHSRAPLAATEQPMALDAPAVGETDELAAVGLPPGPPPVAAPPPKAVTFAEPAPVFSATGSQPESLAAGADAADAELTTLQRAKTKEGDAAGTATEMPLGSPSAGAAASPGVGSPDGAPADAAPPPSNTAKARAALQGTGLTDDALPGAVTVGGVAAAIGAAAAAVGIASGTSEATVEPGETHLCCSLHCCCALLLFAWCSASV